MITDDKKSILERVNFFCAFFIWSDPELALCHALTRKVLSKTNVWTWLIDIVFSKDPIFFLSSNYWSEEGDVLLALDRAEARLLASVGWFQKTPAWSGNGVGPQHLWAVSKSWQNSSHRCCLLVPPSSHSLHFERFSFALDSVKSSHPPCFQDHFAWSSGAFDGSTRFSDLPPREEGVQAEVRNRCLPQHRDFQGVFKTCEEEQFNAAAIREGIKKKSTFFRKKS